MENRHLTKKEVESSVASAFRRQFSELTFRSNPDIIITGLDTSGSVGFNEIPIEEFYGEGTYAMHGWATVFAESDSHIMQSIRCSFDVNVTVQKDCGNVKVSFQQPIFIRRKI